RPATGIDPIEPGIQQFVAGPWPPGGSRVPMWMWRFLGGSFVGWGGAPGGGVVWGGGCGGVSGVGGGAVRGSAGAGGGGGGGAARVCLGGVRLSGWACHGGCAPWRTSGRCTGRGAPRSRRACCRSAGGG